MEIQALERRARGLLILFIVALLISGFTAFPLKLELDHLNRLAGPETLLADIWPSLSDWIHRVHTGLQATYRQYPFVAYGTDWLAFAHIVIAIAFVGPLREPVRNLWVIEWGMIACVLVVPLALICGPIRGIPPFWRLIDCSFGIVGIIPLWLCRNIIVKMSRLETVTSLEQRVKRFETAA